MKGSSNMDIIMAQYEAGAEGLYRKKSGNVFLSGYEFRFQRGNLISQLSSAVNFVNVFYKFFT